MRPVNLLPAQHRPRAASAGGNRAYALLGGLALVLAAVVLYVMTVNQVRGDTAEAARLDREAAGLEAQAQALAPYTEFAKVAETRTTSIRALATGRFDWERLVREVSHVLPTNVWLLKVDATAKPTSTAGSAAAPAGAGAAAAAGGAGAASAPGATGAAPAGATAAAGNTPSMKIDGCAFEQHDVADTLVRLRQLHAAAEVTLDKSERPSGASDASSSSGGASQGCGQRRGRPNVQFTVIVAFDPAATAGTQNAGRVPARLGGGQ